MELLTITLKVPQKDIKDFLYAVGTTTSAYGYAYASHVQETDSGWFIVDLNVDNTIDEFNREDTLKQLGISIGNSGCKGKIKAIEVSLGGISMAGKQYSRKCLGYLSDFSHGIVELDD